MGRSAIGSIGSTTMVMALGTNVDVGIVLVGQGARSGDEIVPGRIERIIILIGINRRNAAVGQLETSTGQNIGEGNYSRQNVCVGVAAVRVVADRAALGDSCRIRWWRVVVEHREADAPVVATPATIGV